MAEMSGGVVAVADAPGIRTGTLAERARTPGDRAAAIGAPRRLDRRRDRCRSAPLGHVSVCTTRACSCGAGARSPGPTRRRRATWSSQTYFLRAARAAIPLGCPYPTLCRARPARCQSRACRPPATRSRWRPASCPARTIGHMSRRRASGDGDGRGDLPVHRHVHEKWDWAGQVARRPLPVRGRRGHAAMRRRWDPPDPYNRTVVSRPRPRPVMGGRVAEEGRPHAAPRPRSELPRARHAVLSCTAARRGGAGVVQPRAQS